MSMYKTILESASQFNFEPVIVNEGELKRTGKYLAVGMGGSIQGAELVKMWVPQVDIVVHQNYGLPNLNEEDLQNRLIIFSSYSGNTEEVIDAYVKAGEMGLKRAVISAGGRLLELAKSDNVAYVQIPDYGIQPRAALALSLLSFLKILGQEDVLLEVKKLESIFYPELLVEDAKELANTFEGKVPIIYTATEKEILGYIWKINFNETGKIPAFSNIFPELNHNEMNGFDVADSTTPLSKNFYFIFLSDKDDHLKIKKRMEITEKLYTDRKLSCRTIMLNETDRYLRIFNSIALAGLTACFLAERYGLEAEQVPMVEELKKML